MTHLSRFQMPSLADDRSAMANDRRARMEAAHARIKAVLDQLTENAWEDIGAVATADEIDVNFAETRARYMERNVALRAGWLAGA